MRGQWVGAYAGSNSGLAIVDIDQVGGQFRGYAYIYDSNQGLPNIRADINVRAPGGNNLQARLPLQPMHPITGDATTWAALASSYPPGTQIPNYADVQITWTATDLMVLWVTDIGTQGSMKLPSHELGLRRTITPNRR